MKKRKLKQLLAAQEAELREVKGLLITYNQYVMKCVRNIERRPVKELIDSGVIPPVEALSTKISAYIEWIESQRNSTGYLDEWYRGQKEMLEDVQDWIDELIGNSE